MPTALVTGASTGIGAATAAALRRAGYVVRAGVRTPEDEAAATRRGHRPVRLDVTSDSDVARAREVITGEGPLDLLVNNAGIAVAAPVETLAPADLAHQLDVNVVGVHRVTQAFLPALIAARGRVVMVSSISGRVGVPFLSAYAASKHALEGYTDSLRREMRPHGVAVVLVEPGQVATPIWEKSTPSDEEVAALPDRYRARAATIAAGARRGAVDGIPPEQVADVIVAAATSSRPRARYALPLRDRVLARLLPVLPESLTDRLVDRELERLL